MIKRWQSNCRCCRCPSARSKPSGDLDEEDSDDDDLDEDVEIGNVVIDHSNRWDCNNFYLKLLDVSMKHQIKIDKDHPIRKLRDGCG